jgi:hypothetical protein
MSLVKSQPHYFNQLSDSFWSCGINLKVAHIEQVIYGIGYQSVLRESLGIRDRFQVIRGYISVMATLKFIYFCKKKIIMVC